MSATYKLNVKFYNADVDKESSLTINGVDSGVTKTKIETFASKYKIVYGTQYSLNSADLIKTDTTELYPGV